MLQIHSSSSAPAHSSTSIKLSTVPNQSFAPKFIPLRRASIPTFSFTLSPTPSLSVRCRYSQLEPKPFPSSPQRPPPQSVGALPPRVYVGHSIYKGKAALTVSPRPPEFASLDSGAFKISKEGYVLLQFAPAVGTRQYDWNRKQVAYASSVTWGGGYRDIYRFYTQGNARHWLRN